MLPSQELLANALVNIIAMTAVQELSIPWWLAVVEGIPTAWVQVQDVDEENTVCVIIQKSMDRGTACILQKLCTGQLQRACYEAHTRSLQFLSPPIHVHILLSSALLSNTNHCRKCNSELLALGRSMRNFLSNVPSQY